MGAWPLGQARVFNRAHPQPLLRLAGQFPNYGVGRTFRYKNHPPGTTVTITRVRLKVNELFFAWLYNHAHAVLLAHPPPAEREHAIEVSECVTNKRGQL